ncbi:hypothetical protein H8959_019310 [Pygathrix nigripes]
MAAAVAGLLRGGFLPQAGQLPALQTVRYGSKAVTRHRRVMHFQRQKLMAVTEYIPPKPAIHPACLPSPPRPPQEGELVGGLTRLTAQTHSLLQHQPLQLTTLLDQYIREQREKDSVVSASGKPDPPDPVPDS